MQVSDLTPGKYFAFEGKYPIWGTEADIRIKMEEDQEKLKAILPQIEEELRWLDTHKDTIVDHLVEQQGMLGLAEDWASSAEPAEDETQECYLMENGAKVFLPITKEDFAASLRYVSVTVYAGENISLELYLGCEPDYFAGHSIGMKIGADHTLQGGDLWG